MRVLPYFNNVQLPARTGRAAQARPAAPQTPQVDDVAVRSPKVTQGEATGKDVFIPASPVSGVVYSYKTVANSPETPETVIKSGNYSFYQLNGSMQRREMGNVGGKLDLKG
jgi:hypothetical protein